MPIVAIALGAVLLNEQLRLLNLLGLTLILPGVALVNGQLGDGAGRRATGADLEPGGDTAIALPTEGTDREPPSDGARAISDQQQRQSRGPPAGS